MDFATNRNYFRLDRTLFLALKDPELNLKLLLSMASRINRGSD
jgi:hypothetical protein